MSGHIKCLIFGFLAQYSKDNLISEYIFNLVTSSERGVESLRMGTDNVRLTEKRVLVHSRMDSHAICGQI